MQKKQILIAHNSVRKRL